MSLPDPQMWARVKEIAGEAMELHGPERDSFVAGACGGNQALRDEVQKLLRAHACAGVHFMDPPSLSISAPPQRADTDAGSLVGTRIGRYRIKRLIGVGGMGAVYEALQEQPRRTVALKVMRAGIASRSALRRFEYEAQILGRLRHPGIAQVFEAGTHASLTGPVPYFAMEYIPGATPLTDFAAGRGLSTRQRLELFGRICEAVHHGHQKGIIHRDLKPSNLLVDSSGDPKIIDFGVARATDSDMAVTTLQTDLGQLIGTLQYMSPEQCAADPTDLDTRSDVYSLGIVLYEMLTGRLPYTVTRSDLYEAARIIREETPARLSTTDRALRGDLETITFKAIEKDRARRYQSAAELGGDIGRYLRNEPILARPASVAYQARVFARRNKALIAIVIAIASGLVLAVIGTGVGLYRATKERDRVKLAETRAREEAFRARSAAEFLRETLLSANPLLMIPRQATEEDLLYAPWEPVYPAYLEYAGKPGQAATVADILDAAGARLASSFPHDGPARADMLHLVGNTLACTGHPGKGESLLRQALNIRQRVLGPGAAETIACAVDAAVIAGIFDRHGDAVMLLQPAYEASRESFGPCDPRTMQVLRHLTSSMIRIPERGREAVRLVDAAVEQLTALHGSTDARTLVEQGHLATLLMESGDLEKAEEQGRAALAGLGLVRGSESRMLADTQLRLAHILNMKGKVAEAEPLLAATIDYYTRRLGPDHPHVTETSKFRAQMLMALGRLEEAERVVRAILAAEIKVFGPDSLAALKAQGRLARLLNMRGTNPAEAAQCAQVAAERTRAANGEQEDYAVLHATTLALARSRLGDPAAGLQVLQPLRREPPVNSAWVLAYFHTVEGDLHRTLGDLRAAAASLELARGYLEQIRDPSHPNRLEWTRARLALAESQGETDVAAELRARLPGP